MREHNHLLYNARGQPSEGYELLAWAIGTVPTRDSSVCTSSIISSAQFIEERTP